MLTRRIPLLIMYARMRQPKLPFSHSATIDAHHSKRPSYATDTRASMWAGMLIPAGSPCNGLCRPRASKFNTRHGYRLYCRVDRDKTGASGPRGGCARDFVNFRGKNSCIARARRARAAVYRPWIRIPDVAATSSQSCDRKSKFGLRHAIKLIELYYMTKSEFDFR